jgi:type I restriction enzyme S subunit
MGGEFLTGAIPSGWKATTLGEIVRRGGGHVQTGPFGSQLHASDYVAVGVPTIMPVNIGDNRLVEDGIARVSESDADRLSRHRVRAGDIIYSRRGDVERRALVLPEQEGWLCGTGCLKIRLGSGGVDPYYASYFLGHPDIRTWIVRHAIGATMPNLNTSIMEAVPFLVPPLDDQRAIACILGSLDDKIELNRRMNRTLEEMARAIFKSWFIDFDPVHAKAAVRRQHPKWTDDQVSRAACPKLKPEIARLFPDSFEDSDLGEVPKGWAVKTIGDLAEIVGGSTPRTTEAAFWEGGTHAWATPKDLSKLSVPVLLETERQITDDGLAQISSGLLPVGTVLLSSRAPIGYLAIAEVPLAINQGFIAMKPRLGVPNLYLLFWARSAHDEIVSRANGSTFLEISKSSFRPIPLIAPPPEVFAAFERLAKPLFARLVSSEHESRTLAALRDALLPKLISGELRVPDAERIAARCA